MQRLFHQRRDRRFSPGGTFRRKLGLESLEVRRLLASDVMGRAESVSSPAAGDGSAEIATLQIDPLARDATDSGDASPLTAGQWTGQGERIAEGEASDSVHFRFVYDPADDPSGFFRRFPQAKSVLEAAGQRLSARLKDQFDAITPLPGNTSWAPKYNNPATGASKLAPSNLTVGANEIVVFVGSRNLQNLDPPGSQNKLRAYANGIDDYGAKCRGDVCDALVSRLITRGEGVTQGTGARDFAPILGSIAFDTRPSTVDNFYFEDGPMQPGQFRFQTFAEHELAHLLGFGISNSFTNLAAGGRFTGANAKASYGGPVPLHGGHVHQSVAQNRLTIMGPLVDSSALLTDLDFAILDDIGWEVAADNRPTINLTTEDLVLVENAGTVEVTATLSTALKRQLTVPVGLSGAAATHADVQLSSPDFVFHANQRSAAITLTIVNDDVDESTESVTLSLSEDANVRLGSQSDFRLTLFDDDGVQFESVSQIDPASVAGSIDIPGDNQPYGIVFRAAADRSLQITAENVDPIREAVLLIDHDQQVIGTYGSTGLKSAKLIPGQSYAVVFYPRKTVRTFTIGIPGGLAAVTPRTNVLFPQDVNGNGGVSEVDALQIINQLNSAKNDSSVDAATVAGDGFYDVSGDGFITAVDALQVINYLNGRSASSSEPPEGLLEDSVAISMFTAAKDVRREVAPEQEFEALTNASDPVSLDAKTVGGEGDNTPWTRNLSTHLDALDHVMATGAAVDTELLSGIDGLLDERTTEGHW